MNKTRAHAKLIQEIFLLVFIILVIIVVSFISSGKKLTPTKTAPTPHIDTEFNKDALDTVRTSEDNYRKVDINGVGKADPFSI